MILLSEENESIPRSGNTVSVQFANTFFFGTVHRTRSNHLACAVGSIAINVDAGTNVGVDRVS